MPEEVDLIYELTYQLERLRELTSLLILAAGGEIHLPDALVLTHQSIDVAFRHDPEKEETIYRATETIHGKSNDKIQ